MVKPKLLLPLVISGVLMLIWGLASSAPVTAAPLAVDRVSGPPVQQTEQYCLSCHGKPDLQMTLPSGEKLSLYVSPEHLKSSVHSAAGIECEACHTNITTYPHPAIDFQTRRELSRSYYQACQKCHSANYEKAQDSMHAQAAAAGNLNAAICTDCHGAHDVQPPDQPRAKISQTCSQCHQDIFNSYKDSIHGSALINENNPDVPVCTDCHGVHNEQVWVIDRCLQPVSNVMAWSGHLCLQGQLAHHLARKRGLHRLPRYSQHPAGQRSEIDRESG